MPRVSRIKRDAQGLVPAIVQDARTGAVLMLAYMNDDALARTLRSGDSYFWSRSRRQLWRKGAQSGHTQRVVAAALDCDRDTLLLQVEQTDGACHTGRYSCFFYPLAVAGRRAPQDIGPWTAILDRVWEVIIDRKRRPKHGSYVSGLLAGGKDRMLKKIGEEAGELMIASKNGKADRIIEEMADVWFHTLVVLGYHNISPRRIYEELARRFGKPPRARRALGGKPRRRST
ncbi:MAG: bifunctional phosphoribosyl-AMP cyclohydrolase/phosphoribosyl-ATP diphosphatase HisIE [Nitrospirota bacterium]